MNTTTKSGVDPDDDKPEDDVAAIPADDTHKTEKVTKLGRENLDPDEGSD